MNSYQNPNARWMGSPNFTADRAGHDLTQPSWIVLHTMVGTVGAANARFQQAGQQASATYGVSLEGSLVQWVDEKDAAWANGNTGTGGRGDNLDSISIEHEDAGDFNGPRTPALYAASAALVRDVCLRYGIPIDRSHIIGHRECTGNAPTACPDALDMDRIVAAAAAGEDIFMAGPLSDPGIQQQLIDGVTRLVTLVSDGQEELPDSTGQLKPVPTQWAQWLRETLNDVRAKVDAQGTPKVDPGAVATALAQDSAFLDALATAIAHKLGAALDKV